MLKQMGEDQGNIDALMSGAHTAKNPAGNQDRTQPYPEVSGLMVGEPLGAGMQPGDLHAMAAAIGNMVSGTAKDGSFSGPAKIGPGDMVSDFVASDASMSGAEDTFTAPLVGNLVTGSPSHGTSPSNDRGVAGKA